MKQRSARAENSAAFVRTGSIEPKAQPNIFRPAELCAAKAAKREAVLP